MYLPRMVKGFGDGIKTTFLNQIYSYNYISLTEKAEGWLRIEEPLVCSQLDNNLITILLMLSWAHCWEGSTEKTQTEIDLSA